MPTATVYRDGKPIRITPLVAADAEKFVSLASAVRDAQNVMRNNPELVYLGNTLKGVVRDADAPYSERHPDDIYAVLPRLAELLGKHTRAVYSHLDERVNGEVLRNADGTPRHGLMLVSKNTPVPEPFHPAAALSATALGMIPLDGLAFDRTELTDTGPAAVTESGGAKVGGSSVPVIRASVRWRA